MSRRTSLKAAQFNESVIRQMSQMARKYEAINLAQGFPDFPCPEELKKAAHEAIYDDVNQYAVTWGDPQFRLAIAEKASAYLGIPINPDTEITVTCGATEAMAATMLATVDPGDEVIVFEPYYENYGPDAVISGAVPRYVTLHPPAWTFDEAELAAAFNEKTRAIIINTPHNPTGKVFSREELEIIAKYCQKWNVLVFTDEIYEHILYDGHEHVAMASLPGMKDLTVTINGLSKTYSVTGWRIGTIIAPEDITNAIRKMHDFLTVGAPAPLQRAGVTAMRLPSSYYRDLARSYGEKRETMLSILDEAGIKYFRPQGAYYVFTDIGNFGYKTDVEFTHFLVKEIGVAVVPGSSFFSKPELGHRFVRFCFSKKPDTLNAARTRLQKLRDTVRLGFSS
ncbi:MAG TPA: aminotransferase class I/II-fold pyridoxal phosphate-dependent enzyme [Coleofasciculaceae cyanobacterium]|jgi:aminotransferase